MENNRETGDSRTRKARVEERGRKPPEQKRTSWNSVIFGWLVAAGVALVLGGVLSGVLVIGGSDENVARSGLARLLMTLTVAFLVGGYVAGRMAGHHGLKHGLLVVFLSLLVTAILGSFGLAMGAGAAKIFDGVTLPVRPNIRQGLGTILSPAGILVFLLSFLGAAFGGIRGAKPSRENL